MVSLQLPTFVTFFQKEEAIETARLLTKSGNGAEATLQHAFSSDQLDLQTCSDMSGAMFSRADKWKTLEKTAPVPSTVIKFAEDEMERGTIEFLIGPGANTFAPIDEYRREVESLERAGNMSAITLNLLRTQNSYILGFEWRAPAELPASVDTYEL